MFGKELKFNTKQKGLKSNRDISLINLPKSPAIMTSGSSAIFLSENPIEHCDRLKLLLQEKQAGKIFNIFVEEIVAIVDRLLEYKCKSRKQHRVLLPNCLN